jgi:hypothetical protein
MTTAIAKLARSLLYEGFLLYPYRRTSFKNQKRWTLGGLYPRVWAEAQGGTEPWAMQTELLVRGGGASVLTVTTRFLHVLDHADEDARERTLEPWTGRIDALEAPVVTEFEFADTQAVTVRGRRTVACARVAESLFRITTRIENLTVIDTSLAYDDAVRAALVSTHTIFTVEKGELVSLLDPPADAAAAVAACANVGTWPVLVGTEGERTTMLSSPIILYDYPRIAPESPADFFDGTEIDELLTLRILTLTDAEKAEMRAGDPRGRALLEKMEAMGPEDLARLHGAVRSAPECDFRQGDRVRLAPNARADVFDVALAGMAATVVSVEHDFEGKTYLTVTIDDDPGKDLGLTGMPGHRFFFGVDEVVRLEPGQS